MKGWPVLRQAFISKEPIFTPIKIFILVIIRICCRLGQSSRRLHRDTKLMAQRVVNLAKIPEHLKERIKTVPEKPGIYKMKDKYENVIYVGKSKKLRSRVKSYFYTECKQEKIKQMVPRIHDIDVTVTDTHLEAQILECELIKNLKPIYNRQFKNDRKYVYLRIEDDSRHKPLSIVSKRLNEYCTGPFRSRARLAEAVNIIENIYPITKCGRGYEFQYSVLPRSPQGEYYEENRECLKEILFREECLEAFLSDIEKKMEAASIRFQYETASIYRDIAEHVKYINKNRSNKKSEFEDRDILMGEKIEGGYKVFYISSNRVILKKKCKRLTGTIIESFIRQAWELKKQAKHYTDEKRELDFKKIISTELRSNGTKAVSFIDSRFAADQFISNLLKKSSL